MNVRLVHERGGRKKVVHLHPPSAVLGRDHGNTVRIPSPAVSRRHCRLWLKEGLVTLEDLGSVNGTFLNGRRVDGPEVVRPGDNLEVGPVAFTVEYELTPEALARLRETDSSGDEMDMLEALADGDVVTLESLDDLPMVEAVEEEPPVLEEVYEKSPPLSSYPKTEEEKAIPVDFDFDAVSWELPEDGDLRDLMDPEDESHGRGSSRRR